jgi:diguanylate cyclase (GGDEF)-like protein
VEEFFFMPRFGQVSQEQARSYIASCWENCFTMLDKDLFANSTTAVTVFKGNQNVPFTPDKLIPVSVPMELMGSAMGAITLFRTTAVLPHSSEAQYLYVFSSLAVSIVEHAYADQQARLMARTDSLTGIANHRFFHEALSREMARSDRTAAPFTLLLLDIDDFKKVNDTYGHLVGDAVIKELAARINAMIRRGDVFARWGGEEFALLLADTALPGAEILAGRICKAIADKNFSFAGHVFKGSVSVGLAFYMHGMEKNTLIAAADKALYAAKHNGKNQYAVAQPTLPSA